MHIMFFDTVVKSIQSVQTIQYRYMLKDKENVNLVIVFGNLLSWIFIRCNITIVRQLVNI